MTIGIKDKYVAITVAYAGDPLTDLIQALLRLLQKETQVELINLAGETDQHNLLLVLIKSNILKIDLIKAAYFEVYEPDLEEQTPETILTGYEQLFAFAYMVKSNLQTFVKATGTREYMEKWLTPFPQKDFDELENWFREQVRTRNN